MPKILFLSESCLFDHQSGAAQSVRAMLETLSDAGWQVRATTLTCCDGQVEYPLGLAYPALNPQTQAGQQVSLLDAGITYDIVVTQSTQHSALRPWELRSFHTVVGEVLLEWQPDIVLSYCSPLSYPLLAQAKQQGARTVFYLANASYAKEGSALLPKSNEVSEVLVPSQAMADLFLDKLSVVPRVLGNLVSMPFDGQRNLLPERIATRRARYVTMVNPQPNKGGLFFLNIAAQLAASAPELRCRAVESRWGRTQWAELGVSTAALDNLDWQPATDDMARIYEDTALLLVPSLRFEASSRVIAEALLAGIPVLAMRSGGIAEQLNEGGFLFDPPAALQANSVQAPDPADVKPWADFVQVLMRHDELYTRAVGQALTASVEHLPSSRAGLVLETFNALLSSGMPSGLDPQHEALANHQKRLNVQREAINTQVAAGVPIGAGDADDTLYRALLQRSLVQPAIQDALAASQSQAWPRARDILQAYLQQLPEDMTALALLAEVAEAQHQDAEAQVLLERLLALAPGLVQGHQQLLRLLQRTGNPAKALAYSKTLIERWPLQPRFLTLHAGLLATAGQFADAIAVYAAVFKQHDGNVHDWIQYANALITLGRQQEAVTAFRKAIALAPDNGAAWHALSNTKLAVFTKDDVLQMQVQLVRPDLGENNRSNIHFALGKALEDQKAYAESFQHYAQGNQIRRRQGHFDVAQVEEMVAQAKAFYTPTFFAQRAGLGDPSRAPVFVLGMHRAGSTLVEQILASHSQVEGTRELPHMLQIGRDFVSQKQTLNTRLLADLKASELTFLGQQYLHMSSANRHTTRPLFIDKMPANWMHTGFIQLILPNARIIDIRREPMAAGFALFKMNFGRGVEHSYEQRDIARYYSAYCDLMAHFDRLLPGRVHHLSYETLVNDTETEIRRLIDYCGLPFEAACLRYWETERAVQTPSAEQVRQPIYQSAIAQWQHYAAWLEPMQEAFGKRSQVGDQTTRTGLTQASEVENIGRFGRIGSVL